MVCIILFCQTRPRARAYKEVHIKRTRLSTIQNSFQPFLYPIRHCTKKFNFSLYIIHNVLSVNYIPAQLHLIRLTNLCNNIFFIKVRAGSYWRLVDLRTSPSICIWSDLTWFVCLSVSVSVSLQSMTRHFA